MRAVVLALTLMLGAASAAVHAQASVSWDAVGKAVLEAAERERAARAIPSIMIGVVTADGLAWSGGVGEANVGTLYRVGPITQLLTDALVTQFVEQGTLDLDAPVQKYLPDFKPINPFDARVTVRHLLTHRSGLVREPPRCNSFDTQPGTLTETVRSLNATTLVAQPGTTYKYSEAGYAVVGRVLEVVSQKPFERLMQDALLTPLGMKATALRATDEVRARLARTQLAPYDAERFAPPVFDLGTAPAVNLYSNVTDLARFATSLLKRGATVSQSGTMYGYVSDLSVFPSDGFALITLVALDGALPVADRLRDFTARQVRASRSGAYVLSDNVPISLAQSVAGHYQQGPHSLDIRVVGQRTYLEAPGIVGELRREGQRWVLDDVATYRDDITIDAVAKTVSLNGVTYSRQTWQQPPAPDKELLGLIGEYGWEYAVLRIYERDGELYARIGSSHQKLERISPNVYRFPLSGGPYSLEELRFSPGAVSLSGIVFKRRDFGAETEVRSRQSARMGPQLKAQARKITPPAQPPDLRKAELVEVAKLDKQLRLDVRYATPENFMGFAFYDTPEFFLQLPAAEALLRAHRQLVQQHGFGIMLIDGYRPWYITRMFWDAVPPESRAFVADPSQGSRHNRGCAADITLYDLTKGNELEMPGRYDEVSARSSPIFLGGTSQQRWRRDVLKQAMEAQGFTVYDNEWWHFDYQEWRQYPILNVDFRELRD